MHTYVIIIKITYYIFETNIRQRNETGCGIWDFYYG